MSDNETAAEVLRMVRQMEAMRPFRPWQVMLSNNHADPLPFIAEAGMGNVIADDVCDENMGEFIVLCCTAAPALAREVQRLQGEIDRLLDGRTIDRLQAHGDGYQDGHRAGQEAMRERAAAIAAAVEAAHHAASRHDRYHEGCRDAADEIESAIRTLEVSHD